VHLAHDTTTKKQLVCKIVNLDNVRGGNSRDAIRRKFQETDILRQLQHVRDSPIPQPSMLTVISRTYCLMLMRFIPRTLCRENFDVANSQFSNCDIGTHLPSLPQAEILCHFCIVMSSCPSSMVESSSDRLYADFDICTIRELPIEILSQRIYSSHIRRKSHITE
jgi:hypothetical protein